MSKQIGNNIVINERGEAEFYYKYDLEDGRTLESASYEYAFSDYIGIRVVGFCGCVVGNDVADCIRKGNISSLPGFNYDNIIQLGLLNGI